MGFSVGVAARVLTFPLEVGVLLWVLLGVYVLCLLVCRRIATWRWAGWGVMLACFTLGWGWAGEAEQARADALIRDKSAGVWVGVVQGLPAIRGREAVFHFAMLSEGHEFTNRILRVTWRGAPQAIEPGQTWELPMRVRPSSMVDVAGAGYVLAGVSAPRLLGQQWSYHQLRMQLRQAILKAAPQPEGVVTPLLLALVLGDRSMLTQDHWQLFSDTGVSHLIAISGLHIGLIFGCVYFLVFHVGKLFPWYVFANQYRIVGAIFAVAAAWLYGALAGYSVPTLRACIMVTAWVVSSALFPGGRRWVFLLISAVIVLLVDPLSIKHASFWLSFFAVGLILWVIEARVSILGKYRSWLRVQGALFVGLLPLSIVYFGKVALISVVSNAVTIPLIGWLVVPLAFLYCGLLVTDVFPPELLMLVFMAMHWIVRCVLQFLAILQAAGFTWHFPLPPLTFVVFAMVGGVLLCAPSAIPGRWLGVMLLVPLLLREPIYHEGAVEYLGTDKRIPYIQDRQSMLMIVPQDYDSGYVNYHVDRHLQEQGIRHAVDATPWGSYQRWLSTDFAVLRIVFQTEGWRRHSVASMYSIPICQMEEHTAGGARIVPQLEASGRCSLYLEGDWGRVLFLAPETLGGQREFIAQKGKMLARRGVDQLVMLGGEGVSGAVLNRLSPVSVTFLDKRVLEEESVRRLAVRNIVLN